MKLTKPELKALKADTKTKIVFDDALPGFGVRIEPSGVKAFIVEFRPPGAGRTATKKRMTLGRVEVLDLDQARTLARRKLAEVALGGNPHAERAAERKSNTFAEVAKTFLEKRESNLKASSHAEYERIVDKALSPTFGKRALKSITRADVRGWHEDLSEETPISANRALAVFSAIWNFAAKREIVDFHMNPAKGIDRNKENKRERFLTSEEIARLLDALDLGEASGIPWAPPSDKGKKLKHRPKEENALTKLSPHVTGAMKLLMLTGARLREILNLKWAEVDTERGLAFLSDSKTGAKALPLNAAALAEIAILKPLRENDYVVGGGADGKPRADLRKPWLAVTRHAGLGASEAIGRKIIGSRRKAEVDT